MAKRSKTSDDDHQGSDELHEGFLPIANVGRIMKKSIPSNGKISKEAKETVKECVSEFISFITGEASDKCQREKRKTINGDDLLWAMTTLGFDSYVHPLKIYLNNYLDHDEDHKNKAKQDISTDHDHETIGVGSIRINYETCHDHDDHGYEDNLVNAPFGLGQIDHDLDHDDQLGEGKPMAPNW